MPSNAAQSNEIAGLDRDLLSAGRSLADFGIFGLIWLDRDLRVSQVFGKLAEQIVTIKAPITDSIFAFIGLEDEIRSLERTQGRLLELPGIGVAVKDERSRRLNFTISWEPRVSATLVVVYRINAMTELELELSRQTRARLMAEAEARQTSRELAKANADLEAFAAVVSHDLKSPLRHMSFLADAAERDANDGDRQSISGKLDTIRRHADRMSKMLTALFDYSSLGRKEEANEDVDTRLLVDSVCASLPLANFETSIQGEWPTLTTPRAPLDLVLRNLIANAATHHDKERGTITIAARTTNDALKIEVSDDGPGIPLPAQSAIFLPFRTLAQSTSNDSTGMGLAMVIRVLDTIGGTITVESDPEHNRGTKFVVTWPKRVSG